MNVFVVFIWLLSILVFASFFVTDFENRSAYFQAKDFTINDVPEVCNFKLIDYPQLTKDNSPCCVVGGNLTGTRLYTDQGTGLIFELGTYPEYYINVCAGACSTGILPDGTCDGGHGQADYDSCIELLKPKNCKSTANPVARRGSQFYYAKTFSNANCTENETCKN